MAASTVQGVVGFGSNLLAVPVVALIVSRGTAGCDDHSRDSHGSGDGSPRNANRIDWTGSRFILLGRVPGTVFWVSPAAAVVSSQVLAVVIGVFVILGVALLSVLATHLHPGVTPTAATVTGVATGFTGTAAAIDGPPLALLYQHDPPPVFRSTLATLFAIGTAFTLTGLLLGGQLEAWQLLLGLSLMPSFLLGFGLSLVIRPRVETRNLRPAVLTVAAPHRIGRNPPSNDLALSRVAGR